MEAEKVGFLYNGFIRSGGRVLSGPMVLCAQCHEDTDSERSAQDRPVSFPIYNVNILPYKQNCACCNRILVEGRTPLWSELYVAQETK